MSFLQKLFGRKPPPPIDQAKVDAAFLQVQAMARPSLRLVPGGAGRSRLGGQPDMPAGLPWPRRGQIPLCFLGQIDLADARSAGGPDWLPAEGLLLFFHEWNHEPGKLDLGPNQTIAIVHGPAGLRPLDYPPDLPRKGRYGSYAVAFEAATDLPSWERREYLFEDLNVSERDALDALCEKDVAAPKHQIGGYPDPVQWDDMEIECEREAGSAMTWHKPDDTPEAKAQQAKADEWRLLLQLDSDERMGTNWVDTGTLYFWIREQDARAGDFSKACLILQFH